MRSVADDLRRETARSIARLTAAERVALALRLGDADVALHQAAHGTGEVVSRAALSRARASGRIPSISNDAERR